MGDENNEISELADLDRIQSKDLKLMKYFQIVKQDDRWMEMEPKSWARAQEIIRKHAQNMALNADLVEARLKNQGPVMNAMSGESRNPTPRPLSQFPGKQRKK